MYRQLFWGLALLAAMWGGAGSADQSCSPCDVPDAATAPCCMVQGYGAETGGRETIGSLVEINMRGWKPQSKYGIGILGWSLQPLRESLTVVYYKYVERDEIWLAWLVDQQTKGIIPLTPMSGRIMRMADLL